MIKKLIIVYIIIGSLQVYNLSALGSLIRIFHLSAVGLMIAVLLIDLVYFRTKTAKKNFALPIYMIFIAVFVSMFSAFFFFNQSFPISMYAQRDIYFYLFYFTLHVLKVEKKELQKIVIYFGLLYFILYIIQFIAFPTELFDVPMREERGTIRIYLEGVGFAMLSYFMCLQIFYSTRKFTYLILSVIFLVPVILFGARSGLATLVIGTIVQLLFSRQIKSKALIIVLVIISLAPTYFFFQGIFSGLVQITVTDSTSANENIRIVAAQYFLTQFLPNTYTYFTGMGAPSERSQLGQMTLLLSQNYGFYIVDIGIIGNYVTYGVLFVLAILMIIYKTMSIKIRSEMMYLKYFMYFQAFLLLPIAAGFAFSPPIAVFCCIFYLMDISAFERKSGRR